MADSEGIALDHLQVLAEQVGLYACCMTSIWRRKISPLSILPTGTPRAEVAL